MKINQSKLYNYCPQCNMTCNHICIVNGEKYIHNCFYNDNDKKNFFDWYKQQYNLALSHKQSCITIGPFTYFEDYYDAIKKAMDIFEKYYWCKL